MPRITNPYLQTSLLTAAGVGAALLQSDRPTVQIIGGGLGVAAGVLGNLVANRIQKDQDAKDAFELFANSRSLIFRTAEVVELILLNEQRFDNDHETVKIAACAKQYWLTSKGTQNKNQVGNELLPIERFVSLLLNPVEQTVLLGTWLEVLDNSCQLDTTIHVDQLRLHQLAGTLTREIPKQLGEAFSIDLREGTDGFAEIVLRLLIHSLEVTKENGVSSNEQTIISERLDALVTSVESIAKTLEVKLSQNNQVLVTELGLLHNSINVKLDKLAGSQNQLASMVSDILAKLNVQPTQDYDGAIGLVAEKHGITASQVQTVLSEYARRLERDTSELKPLVEAAIAAGNFLQAEQKALDWSHKMAVESEKAQANYDSTRQVESEALRYAGLAAFLAKDVQNALKYYQKALALRSREQNFSDWADCQEGIVGCLLESGKADLALTTTLDIAQAAQKSIPADHKRLFWSDYTLGTILHLMGNLEKAEPFLVRAYLLAMQQFKQDDPRMLSSLYSVASYALDAKNFAKAEELARSHFHLAQQTSQLNTTIGIVGVYLLAKILRFKGEFEESESTQLQALDLTRRYILPLNPQYGLCLNELGLVYHNQGRYGDAEQRFKRAIIFEEESGRADSLNVGNYTANLGRLYIAMTRWNEAEEMLTRSYTIRTSKLSAEHPKAIEVLACINQVNAERVKDLEGPRQTENKVWYS